MKLKGAQTSPFGRRFSKDHPGFDPLKRAGQLYRIEKRVGDVYVPVSSTVSVDKALAFLKGKGWDARVMRIRDGEQVWP